MLKSDLEWALPTLVRRALVTAEFASVLPCDFREEFSKTSAQRTTAPSSAVQVTETLTPSSSPTRQYFFQSCVSSLSISLAYFILFCHRLQILNTCCGLVYDNGKEHEFAFHRLFKARSRNRIQSEQVSALQLFNAVSWFSKQFHSSVKLSELTRR